jgi:hypothetical protein
MGTTEGVERLRHGAGDEEVWPWLLFLQLGVEPLLRLLVLTLGTRRLPQEWRMR